MKIFFYDPVLATVILDRFVHPCHFVVIKGESCRVKHREKKPIILF
nr:ATP-binding protein [Caldicellulosiruptor obsidiansis]